MTDTDPHLDDSEWDDDPDDFQRGLYGQDMVDWQPPPPVSDQSVPASVPNPALDAYLRSEAPMPDTAINETTLAEWVRHDGETS